MFVLKYIVMKSTIHHGKNVKLLREMLGLKQDELALDLGDGWSELKVYQLELKELIDYPTIEEIARALKVVPEAINSFDYDAVIKSISSFYESTFNPTEKLIEVMNDNRKLYERLVESEREKTDILKFLLKDKLVFFF